MDSDGDVVVSKEMLKAIGADTRINILKALKERQKTQSELATELKLSPPTVLDHVQQLENAKLIKRSEESIERKWKYYELTSTGRKLVERKRINMIFLLSALALFVIAAFALFYTNPFSVQGSNFVSVSQKSFAPIEVNSEIIPTSNQIFVIEKSSGTSTDSNAEFLNNQTSQNSSVRTPAEAPPLSRSVITEPRDQPSPGVNSPEPAPAIQENNTNLTNHTQNSSG
ncbi:MAG: winged helix-turn-helix domain-containing protein [Candidatus Micrarchaeota archaeon]